MPPGPICTPGRSAIEATLNPAKTNDIFFVADGSSGGHIFTTNLKDHNAAVQSYRKFERDQKAKQAAPAAAAAPEPAAVAAPPAADPPASKKKSPPPKKAAP